ncbi:hypothetical protein QBC47DRAFT_444887, partial [Echria macrotheca]
GKDSRKEELKERGGSDLALRKNGRQGAISQNLQLHLHPLLLAAVRTNKEPNLGIQTKKLTGLAVPASVIGTPGDRGRAVQKGSLRVRILQRGHGRKEDRRGGGNLEEITGGAGNMEHITGRGGTGGDRNLEEITRSRKRSGETTTGSLSDHLLISSIKVADRHSRSPAVGSNSRGRKRRGTTNDGQGKLVHLSTSGDGLPTGSLDGETVLAAEMSLPGGHDGVVDGSRAFDTGLGVEELVLGVPVPLAVTFVALKAADAARLGRAEVARGAHTRGKETRSILGVGASSSVPAPGASRQGQVCELHLTDVADRVRLLTTGWLRGHH